MAVESDVHLYFLDVALQPNSLDQLTRDEKMSLIIILAIVVIALTIGTFSIIKQIKKCEYIGQDDVSC